MTEVHDDNSDVLQAWIDDELDASQTDAFETGLLDDAPARLTAAEHLALDRGLKSLLANDSHERDIVAEVRQRIHTGSQPLPAPDLPAEAATNAEHPPVLRFISGKRLGQLLSLQRQSMTIGRREAADIVVAEPGVSGLHAELSLVDGSLIIRDLGSTNGTWVAGQRLDGPRILTVGDAVTIGTTQLLACDGNLLGDVRLLGIEGPALGTEFVIGTQPSVIGRKAASHLVLADAAASGHHAQIWRDGLQVVIEDLGSNNGTWVDGRSIDAPTALHSGARIAIGKSRFLYIDGRVDDLAGTALSGYLLLNRIGAGKAGVVYRARNPHNDSIVAVKCFDPSRCADPAQRARLVNALRSLKRIEDPHIVPIIDSGESDGLLFLAMPWYENGSLRDLIHLEEPLPSSVIMALISDAAKALATADDSHRLRHDGLDDGDILISDDGHGLVADIGLVQAPLRPSGDTPLAVSQFFLGEILRRALRQGHDEAGRQLDDLRHNQDLHSSVVDIIERCTAADAGERFPDWSSLQDALHNALSRCVQRERGQLAQRATIVAPVEGEPETLRATRSSSAGEQALVPRPTPGGDLARRPTAVSAPVSKERIPAGVLALICCAIGLLVVLILTPTIVRSIRSDPAVEPRRDVSLSSYHAREARQDSARQDPTSSRPPITNLQPPIPRRLAPASPREDQAQTSDSAAAPADDPDAGELLARRSPRTPDSADLADELLPRRHAEGRDTTSEAAAAERPDPQTRATAQTPTTRPEPTTSPEPSTVTAPPETSAPETSPVRTRQDGGATDRRTAAHIDRPGIDRLLAMARPDTWEQVSVTLVDGSEIDGDMRVDGRSITLRHNGEEQGLDGSRVAALSYRPIADLYARNGDNDFRRQRFDRAIESYRRALERNPEHPYLISQIDLAERHEQRLATVNNNLPQAIADNDWSAILAHAETWFEITEPNSIERGFGQALREAFARRALTMDEHERQAWIERGQQVRLRMEYDPEAPAYLAAAMASFAGEEAPRETMAHFTQALRAHAPMDDEHWWAYARTCAALNNNEEAARALVRLSPTASERAEVRALGVQIGLRPPPLRPRLVCLTYIGGRGNQAIQEVGFSANGTPFARGNGFQFNFDPASGRVAVNGDINQCLGDNIPRYRPPLAAQSVTVPATGERLTIRYRQVAGHLQQPQLDSDGGWRFWGWSLAQANQRSLMADSRGYDIWLYPDGRHVGIMGWTDGGNSVFARDPQDLDTSIEKSQIFTGGFSNVIGGMSTVLMKIDVVERRPVSGTFIASHVFNHAQDRWGRTYIPQQCNRRWAGSTLTDPFGVGEVRSSALFVLDTDLKSNIFHGAIGGRNAQRQSLGLIAVHGNLAILGGFTDATEMTTVNAYQEQPGGGLDAMVAVVELWPTGR